MWTARGSLRGGGRFPGASRDDPPTLVLFLMLKKHLNIMIFCGGPDRSEILSRFNNSGRQTTLSVTIAAKCLLRRMKAEKKLRLTRMRSINASTSEEDLLATLRQTPHALN
jgi:hypothetical protein